MIIELIILLLLLQLLELKIITHCFVVFLDLPPPCRTVHRPFPIVFDNETSSSTDFLLSPALLVGFLYECVSLTLKFNRLAAALSAAAAVSVEGRDGGDDDNNIKNVGIGTLTCQA